MRQSLILAVTALCTLLSAGKILADDTRLQWFGQAAFRITTPSGKVILIDPFISGNPKTPKALKDLSKLSRVDLILVTHGHADHIGDTVELARQSGAMVAMNAGMAQTFAALGWVPAEKLIGFNKSGVIRPVGDDVTVTMVRAEHSSEVRHVDPESGSVTVHPGGEPVGYIIEITGGPTIYHAGDTGVFGDMAVVAEYYRPELALLPIGGHYTMDPEHAAWAVRNLLKTPVVIPMHYGTFPLLKGTPEEFREQLGESSSTILEMQPGQEIVLGKTGGSRK